MNWIALTKPEQIEELKKESRENPVIVFKHSTACSISATAKNRVERQWAEAGLQDVKPYYLDLLSFRSLSNRIAEQFAVTHQSPQLLVIQDEACVYNASHLSINLSEVKRKLAA
ncbi:bacillithiol system redox-active protein YtxJ [soil metagenome]